MCDNYSVGKALKYSWDERKRQENISKRGLDIVLLADKVFADPNVVIEPDVKKDYGEDRFHAYGMADNLRIRICFTLRGERLHLITVHRMHRKPWEKHYG
jgi:hypothetical protein